MTDFGLDPRLAQDTMPIGDWPLCRLLLMNNASCPWLILVPRRPGLVEITDLDAPDRALLMAEVAAAADALKRHAGADKMNVAALGNQVAQLHVHVIARFRHDPAWPNPVWGNLAPHPYPDGTTVQALKSLLIPPAS